MVGMTGAPGKNSSKVDTMASYSGPEVGETVPSSVMRWEISTSSARSPSASRSTWSMSSCVCPGSGRMSSSIHATDGSTLMALPARRTVGEMVRWLIAWE